MRVPTANTLTKTFGIDRKTANLIRAIARNEQAVEIVPQTEAWMRQCYNRPSTRELQRHAIAALLNSHGLEAIHGRSGCVIAEYANMGDPYAVTLIFKRDNCFVGSWGDFVEAYERKHGRLP